MSSRNRSVRVLIAFASFLLASVTSDAQVPYENGEWPQWRGPKRDGHGLDTGLLKKWPEDGPAVAWEVDSVGVGYSSLAIKDGRIVTQGDLNGVEHVICLNEKDGKLLWAVQPAPVAKKLAARIADEFKKIDKNGDGVVDDVEAAGRIKNAAQYDRPVEGDPQKIAALRAARVLAGLDKNGDGLLDEIEAGRALGSEFFSMDQPDPNADASAIAKARSARLLKALDKDGDSKISKKEARRSVIDRSFRQIDRKPKGKDQRRDDVVTQEELESFFKNDKGRDGLVTAKELGAYYARRHPSKDGVLSQDELKGHFGGYRNGQGDGPRGTPVIDGDRVYTEGGFGDVTCFDVKTGKTLWHRSLTDDFGGRRPGWGYSESPLVVDDFVIVTPGGSRGTVVALDKVSGESRWSSSETTQSAHYSSPIIAELAGVRQVVQFSRESCFGVDLEKGNVLWQYKNANNGTANCTTPIVLGDHVFAASAYGTGGGLAKISKSGDDPRAVELRADEVYFEKRMANHHGGIVGVGDHMYGFGNGGLICMDILTGKVAWTDRSVRKGSLVYADGMLYCLGERHEMALVEATPEEYRERGRFKVENRGRPSWAHPVVAGGRLYIRNQGTLTAYKVR